MQTASRSTILTIDDDFFVRESIAAYLEDYDYSVLQAENGRIGLDIFRRESPDLILVDLRMPEVDGLDVLGHVSRESPDTPMIVISGTGILGDALETLRLGAWDFILKPIKDLDVLGSAVRRSLEKSRRLKEDKLRQERLEGLVSERNAALEKEMDERRRIETALWESEEKYQTILEANPDPVVVHDLEGRVLYLNSAFTRVFGWTLEERAGEKLEFFAPEENWPETRMMIEKALAGETVAGVETHRYTKDGNLIPVSVSGAAYRGRDGAPAGGVRVLRDMTALTRVREEKRGLENRLLQAHKMATLGMLAGGIAHDFNNILFSLIGYTEISMEDAEPGGLLREDLNEILKAGIRAKDLVDEMLTFSRQAEKELIPIRVKLIVKEVLKLLGSSLPKTVELRRDIGSDSVVMADPAQIHQILMNICGNAGHAMGETGGILDVKLSNVHFDEDDARRLPDVKAGRHVCLRISDTGLGMSRAALEQIFDPFYTTINGEGETGSDLEAFHGSVKIRGGVVHVSSEPGKGATFKVFLPIDGVNGEPDDERGAAIANGL